MDGRSIYVLTGAPLGGKDTVIEYMVKHTFQGITDTKNSMVLSYSFIDDSKDRAKLIGIKPEKTPEFRKFLSDDADNMDNFDPENRGYGYRVYRFLNWLDDNTDERTAAIMVNLRQMKGIVSMGKAVHAKNYRVRILRVDGRGLTPEEMSNEGDKEYLSWPDDIFHHVFDNSRDLDYLENQVREFVNKERQEIADNIAAWNETVECVQAAAEAGTLETHINIPPLPVISHGVKAGEAFIVSVDAGDPDLGKSVMTTRAVGIPTLPPGSRFYTSDGEVKFLARDASGVIYSEFVDEMNRKIAEGSSPKVEHVQIKVTNKFDIPYSIGTVGSDEAVVVSKNLDGSPHVVAAEFKPGGELGPIKGGFNSPDDFSLPVVVVTGDPVQPGSGTTKPIRGRTEHYTVFDDAAFVPFGTTVGERLLNDDSGEKNEN